MCAFDFNKFTLDEGACDRLMQEKYDLKYIYTREAKKFTINELRKILLGLALDEQKHHDILKKIKMGVDSTMTETTVLDEAKNLIQNLVTKRLVVDNLQVVTAGFEYYMEREADSCRLYEDMAKNEKNPGRAQLLQKIADDERKHFSILDNFNNFAQDPQSFPGWSEFSDFKGY